MNKKEARDASIQARFLLRNDSFDGADIFVEVYADRIEVINPGSLPKGLTLADLGHMSIRRNPLITDLFHRINFIEKAGTGICRVRDRARAQDCPEPEFGIDRFFTITFRPNPEVRAVSGDGWAIRNVAGKAPQVTPPPSHPPSNPSSHPSSAPQVTPKFLGKRHPKFG